MYCICLKSVLGECTIISSQSGCFEIQKTRAWNQDAVECMEINLTDAGMQAQDMNAYIMSGCDGSPHSNKDVPQWKRGRDGGRERERKKEIVCD